MTSPKTPSFATLKRALPPTTQIVREVQALQDQSEAEVSKACRDWLDLHGYRWIRVQTGNLLAKYGPKTRMIQCAKPGTADCLVILPPNGYALWLEWKRTKGGVQSPEQREFAEWCASVGAGYRLIRSMDELASAMREEVENAKVVRPL